jgi:Ca2+-binding RTX toxin-like protein
MAQYTSFGYDFTSPGHKLWAFVFVGDPFESNYDSANSNSGRLVYNNSDGTKTFINGTGLANGQGVAWTTLTSLEHLAADGSTVLERIDNLGTTGASPGISLRSELAALLLNGNDTFTGSSGTDAVRSGDGGDTLFGGAGADSLDGGAGADTFRLTAGDFVAGEQIFGGSGDTIQLENVGNLDLTIGTATAEIVNFFSGTSAVTISAPIVAGGSYFKTFIGSAQADTLILTGASGVNLSGVTFTNWTPGQDTITISVGGGNFGTVTGTAQNDIFTLIDPSIGSLSGNAGDDTFLFSGTSNGHPDINGGIGTDTIKTQNVTLDFSAATIASVESLVFDTGLSSVTFSQAQLNAGAVPAITGSANSDIVIITSPVFVAGVGHIDASALVLNSWTDPVDALILTDNANGTSTSFIGSSHRDMILGNNGPDILNGKGGSDLLFGGTGADKFVFDAVALTDAQSAIFDSVKDYDKGGGAAYNSGEGDQIDLSALLSAAYNHGSGQAVASLVRAVEDSSGTFAKLQVDTDGTANGVNWITIARLDGLQPGNAVNIILDPTLPGGSNITVKTSIFGQPTATLAAFNPGNGWTSEDAFYRELADVNGDHKADIIGFGNGGVYVALATGGGNFAAPAITLSGAFNPGNGWTSQDQFPRELADVNGDGMADIVAFGNGGVYVSLATGGGNFATAAITLNAFNPGNGWTTQDQFPRELADVNGDGMADIVAFGNGGVYVSLATGGGNFAAATIKLAVLNPGNGWTSQDQFPRELADVNGDGMADIVGFGNGGAYVALATGGGNFATPIIGLSSALNPGNGWTTQHQFPRELGDVNHDGMADIVGFGNGGVYVALATGGGHFATPVIDIAAFNPANGWTGQDAFPRQLADVNGDGQADIVGYGNPGVLVALANDFHLI